MIADTIDMTDCSRQIREALSRVMDPEIPILSVIDLGMIGELQIHDDRIAIPLVPTFTACPALMLLQHQIHEAVTALGFRNVEVFKDDSVTWNTDRISEEGKKKLEQFGLGIPQRHGGNFSLDAIIHSKCPHCGSDNTTMNSLFGSTLCRSIHYCFNCKQSFERFKPL